jgi:hypothetical protein
VTRKARTKHADDAAPAAPAEAPREKKKRPAEAAPEPTERQPDFIWSGQPVYECHLGCRDRFQRIGDLPAVLEHEKTAHPTNLRVTEVLGPDGRPLIVRAD